MTGMTIYNFVEQLKSKFNGKFSSLFDGSSSPTSVSCYLGANKFYIHYVKDGTWIISTDGETRIVLDELYGAIKEIIGAEAICSYDWLGKVLVYPTIEWNVIDPDGRISYLVNEEASCDSVIDNLKLFGLRNKKDYLPKKSENLEEKEENGVKEMKRNELLELLTKEFEGSLTYDEECVSDDLILFRIGENIVKIHYKKDESLRVLILDQPIEVINKLNDLLCAFMGGKEPICAYESVGKELTFFTVEWNVLNPDERISMLKNGESNDDGFEIRNLKVLKPKHTRKIDFYKKREWLIDCFQEKSYIAYRDFIKITLPAIIEAILNAGHYSKLVNDLDLEFRIGRDGYFSDLGPIGEENICPSISEVLHLPEFAFLMNQFEETYELGDISIYNKILYFQIRATLKELIDAYYMELQRLEYYESREDDGNIRELKKV